MNNYYSLIYLNRELNDKLEDGFFDFAITPHKFVLELYIYNKNNRFRLEFSSHPEETALFWSEYRPPKKSNTGSFFESLKGEKILGTSLAHMDRLLTIHFEDDQSLVFKMFSGRPNVWYAKGDIITDAFRQPDDWIGKTLPQPHSPSFETEVPVKASPKNQLLRLNPLLPRNLVPHIVEQHRVGEMNADEVKTFVQQLTRELENTASFRVLETLELCLWSEEIVTIPTQSVYEHINPAIREVYRSSSDERRLRQDRQRWLDRLERERDRLEQLVKELQQADKSLERADRYERFGHLLMTKAHEKIQPEQESVSVADFYEDGQPTIQISIKADRSVSKNADRYYQKAQAARRSYEEAQKRLPKVKDELSKVKSWIDSLKKAERHYEYRDWYKEHKADLQPLEQTEQVREKKPFRVMQLGSYELWVGRNARSNDQLTSAAHKEDIWMHARGVSGSHVVIRMDNHKEYPPKSIIEAAARIAAWHSKARGSTYAPVMYTKKKYVRKSKGAAPGAVTVEREEVIMVEPTKPNQQWMKHIGG